MVAYSLRVYCWMFLVFVFILLLAAIHFNENGQKMQVVPRNGTRYSIHWKITQSRKSKQKNCGRYLGFCFLLSRCHGRNTYIQVSVFYFVPTNHKYKIWKIISFKGGWTTDCRGCFTDKKKTTPIPQCGHDEIPIIIQDTFTVPK